MVIEILSFLYQVCGMLLDRKENRPRGHYFSGNCYSHVLIVNYIFLCRLVLYIKHSFIHHFSCSTQQSYEVDRKGIIPVLNLDSLILNDSPKVPGTKRGGCRPRGSICSCVRWDAGCVRGWVHTSSSYHGVLTEA